MTALAPRLTAEMVPHLKRAAQTRYGRLFDTASEARKHGPLVMKMHAAKLVFWDSDGARSPLITEEGRRAVDGPSMAELLRREIAEHSSQ